MKKLLQQLIWSLCLIGGGLFAQNHQQKKAKKLYENLAYVDAMKIYTDLVDKGVKDVNVYRKLGDAYYFNAKYKDAADWYTKALALDTNPPAEYNFRYGQVLKAVGQMDESDVYLKKFYKSHSAEFLPSSEYISSIEKNSGKFSIEKVNFNSEYSDYPGSLYNGILYVITADMSNKTNPWNEEPASDIFKGSGLVAMGKNINTKYNEGSLVITKDGNTMYFTRNDYVDRKLGRDSKKVTRLKLLRSDKNEDGKWSKPQELPFNNSEYSVGHPALSADETKLYFVSDMPSSKGGTDLFESEIFNDGTYGPPVNLIAFNTLGNEMSLRR